MPLPVVVLTASTVGLVSELATAGTMAAAVPSRAAKAR
jgi:hypothetical protein